MKKRCKLCNSKITKNDSIYSKKTIKKILGTELICRYCINDVVTRILQDCFDTEKYLSSVR